MKELPDIVDYNLEIFFVGFNPSVTSSLEGHHFAGRNNRFWKVLYLAGLTPALFSYSEDYKLLSLGYGLTNIVSRPTKDAVSITKEEFLEGSKLLQNKLLTYQPEIVCYVGAGVFKAYTGKEKENWGFQNKQYLPGMRDFVAPNTSGLVRMTLEQQVEIYRGLKERSPF